MQIGIASDHAGFAYKQHLQAYLIEKGWEVKDFGTDSEGSCDYPDYAHPLAQAVHSATLPKGILICGSGEGVSMTANKYPNVRAALVWNAEVASLARRHNNANVICLPARFISIEEAETFLEVFLQTKFEGGRHARRVNKIADNICV